MVDGYNYSVVVDHKPSQKEAMTLILNKIQSSPSNLSNVKGSFGALADEYISNCEKRDLSPSTIRGYVSISRNVPEWFKEMPIYKIAQSELQEVVNDYARNHSPKSARSFYGFINSVLKSKNPDFSCHIKLPNIQKKAEYEPSTDDIKRILDASVGSRYECVLRLCSLALRRGEAIAITASDLDDNNILTINKDIVVDKNGNHIIKDKPKTEDSFRRILIPASTADLIRKQGHAFKGNPHTINEYLHKLQDKLGIPRFRLHMMRHFAVAYLHSEGFTDSQILSYGGWAENSDVMKRVYRYNLNPEESQKDIADKFGSL